MVLTAKQKEELNKSILEYLHASGYSGAAKSLEAEANVQRDVAMDGLLEKKWNSIIRLQRRINELESQVSQLQEEVSSGRGSRAKTQSRADSIPRPSIQHTLSDHRNPITNVAFHPKFNILASSSEDATIKIWDAEFGEFQKNSQRTHKCSSRGCL
eukprot:TRINITY_DN5651_c0_g2_i3.p1 TRINITY_DN5651_c0_g2~~TRINITY_DN5651_c0_g2_i3.p1  ORF type:complete len:156 (-),score=43.20 TRINITY_DN5651_c0_g2_i3:115-582(-)